MRFKKAKCWVQHLGHKTPMNTPSLGQGGWKLLSRERPWGVDGLLAKDEPVCVQEAKKSNNILA